MVDALRRAHRMAGPNGRVIDLHPSEAHASLEVGGTITGRVDSGSAPLRHRAADRALEAAIVDGLFKSERSLTFTFYTYGDSIEELRDHIVETWREGRIAVDVIDRTRQALCLTPGSRPRVREEVHAASLLSISLLNG